MKLLVTGGAGFIGSAFERLVLAERPDSHIVTLDNHYVHGGQGEMVAAAVASLGLQPSVTVSTIGVSGLPECGTNDEVLAYHGLDVASLVRIIRTVAENRRRDVVSQTA